MFTYPRHWCRDQDMAPDLERMKNVRTAYKGHCTRNTTRAEVIMSSDNPDVVELENLLENLTLRMEKIVSISGQVLDLVSPDDIEQEVQSSLV